MRPELDDTATLQGPVQVPSGDQLAPGTRLDHFRIDKKLGAGGMGEVYLATDLALDRPVAIKVLPPGSSSGDARDRLVREARAQARVHHPNVAHIYYIGEDAGRLYFAMEYIAGGTFAEAGQLAVPDALAAVHAAALGLREAQAQGFLHRDVKPSNLMRDAHGTVKVLDFGLAAGGDAAALEDGPVTQTTIAGTPLYMAPEQARGDAIDLRADIYALGATLYHLVAGKPPFQADSVDELQTLHRSAARPALPRKSSARTDAAAVDALVARMMAPDPAARFASYDELLRAIEMASAQHTKPAGLWVRAIAAFIDFTLVGIIVGVARSVITGDGTGTVGTYVLPALGLVQALAVWRWGTTLGKALFELEIVDVETARRPTLRRALVRSLVLYGPVTATDWLNVAARQLDVTPMFVFSLLVAIAYVGGILALVHASLRVPGKRTPWDRIAGTMVRYRAARRK